MSTTFCAECNNLLYPKEDKLNKQLLYACRNCEFEQPAPSGTVYHHQILQSAMDQTTASVDLSHDPTYPRTKNTCPMCGHEEAVFFQSRSKAKDVTMKVNLFLVVFIIQIALFCML